MKEPTPPLGVHPTNERNMPHVESLDRAREIMKKWEPLAKKFGMAKQMVDEMLLQHPELANEISADAQPTAGDHSQESKGAAGHPQELDADGMSDQDREALANKIGDISQALSPESLKKMYGSAEQEDHEADANQVVPIVPVPPIPPIPPAPTVPRNPIQQPSAPAQSITAAPTIKNLGTTAPQSPDQGTSAAQARARAVAEKIKHHPMKMVAEDWDFERDPENRKLIDQALMDMREISEPVDESTLIAAGRPTIDHSRTDLNHGMAKYRDAIAGESLEPDQKQHLEYLQKAYDENHHAEYQRIYAEEGRAAAMRFVLREQMMFTRDRIKELGQKQQERIKKISGKIAGGAFGLAVLAGVAAIEAGKYLKKKIQSVNVSKAYENLKKKFSEPSQRTPLREKLKSFVTGKPLERDAKKAEEAAKAAEKAREEETKLKEKDAPKEAVESEAGIEFKKAQYVEKQLEPGEKLTGKNLDGWNRLKKGLSVKYFIFPEDDQAPWGPDVKAKIKSGETSAVDHYAPYAKKVYADLRRYVEEKNISRADLDKLKTVDALLERAIKDGFVS